MVGLAGGEEGLRRDEQRPLNDYCCSSSPLFFKGVVERSSARTSPMDRTETRCEVTFDGKIR